MAKPNFPEKQTTWGTWEELLLACAVHRYGTDSWDSVASELRKRTSTPHLLLTPHSCKHKYHDLKRRFARNDVVSAPSDENDDGAAIATSTPFLDELRRLRVAELRREVERYDLSIVSLETKVEKLKEEREQSSKGPEKPDLEKESKDEDEEEEEETVRSEGASPENMAEKAVSGEGSVYDESNSTNLKGEAPPGPEPATSPPIPAEPASAAAGEPDRVREYGKLAVEDSYNGSSETIGKESAAVSPVQESEKVESEKNGGGDSAESKEQEEEGTKEVCSSEMQSSTSLSRKKKVEESDEPGDQSVDTKRAPIESQSFIDFLEILRSHKSGSFFERRLEIQETPKYINTIRQHMDFDMVRNRLEEGWYSGCKSKFFRDLLLIFNNAIVFFGRKSPESKAAIELRHLLLKEMALKTTTKRDSLPKDETQALPSKKEPEEQEQPSEMLLRKPKLSVPMNACRKRSSITARASTSSSGAERKKEQTNALLDVKSAMSWKQSDKSSSDKADEFSGTKKKRKERFRTGARNSSNKNGASTEINKNSCSNTNVGTSSRGASNEHSPSKATDKEKNNSSSTASGKKRSATNFLNRMKRSSSSNNGSLLETLKDSDNSSRGGAEQKKNGAGKGSNSSSRQKEQASRRTSGSKQAKEPESPAKRSVGRPSKRTASVAAAAVVPAKRSRQSVENEALAPRNAKKRSRK